MKFSTNTLYGLSASLFTLSLVGIFNRWTKAGSLLYYLLFISSIAIGYYAYRKSHKDVNITADDVNLKLAGTGALLILIDVSYNLIKHDPFKSFDYSMILAGLFYRYTPQLCCDWDKSK